MIGKHTNATLTTFMNEPVAQKDQPTKHNDGRRSEIIRLFVLKKTSNGCLRKQRKDGGLGHAEVQSIYSTIEQHSTTRCLRRLRMK
jgi:hypothetical protein